MKIETREVLSPLAIKPDEAGAESNHLVGHAAIFNSESQLLFDAEVDRRRGFIEVIAPGAFTRTLREGPDVVAIYNHNTSEVLGRVSSGSLKLWEDDVGLAYDDDLPDTTAARDVKTLVRRGDLKGCSFGFSVVEDDLEDRDGRLIRTLYDVELFEVTLGCAFPA